MSLHIDFSPHRQQSKKHWLGLSLGSATVTLLCVLAWSMSNESEAGFHFAQESLSGEESRLALNKAIDDLNFPWLAVLVLLEENTSPDLRLGQLEADSRSGRLSLQGEARNNRSVLALPENLRKSPLVSDVRIVSQSTANSSENNEFPTRFALEIQFFPAEER